MSRVSNQPGAGISTSSQFDAPAAVGRGAPGEWWRNGVVYQVYPRSFQDSNGDGVGDLPGIIAHLDHLAGAGAGLAVDAVWLSPIYPSPGLDGGYDVSDHRGVDPVFGSLADFDRLVEAAHARGLRILLDLVLNHTSDQHPWFSESRRSRDNPRANWYIWRDPASLDRRGRPRLPNNWVSYFGGPAWAWEPARGQFYLHTFLPQQPDLNWREPAVREAQFDMVQGWLDRGVDGFRLDVFNALLKSQDFESNPRRRGAARRPWDRQRHLFDKDNPELGTLLGQFRALLDARGAGMSVGELFEGNVRLAAALSEPRHLVFDFSILEQPWSAAAFRRAIGIQEAAYGPDRWPAVVLSNHDRSRHVSRYLRKIGRRDPGTADRVARAAAVLLLSLRGTPFLYYGEEIGMQDVRIPIDEIQDPPARRASWLFPWWNRDQCRAPMPWTSGRNGGFTAGRPWITMPPDHASRNVEAQGHTAGSVLATYRRLLAIRRASPALHEGTFAFLPSHADALIYLREAAGERVLVAVNFATGLRRLDVPPGRWTWLFDTDRTADGPEPSEVVASASRGQVLLRGLQAVLLRELPVAG